MLGRPQYLSFRPGNLSKMDSNVLDGSFRKVILNIQRGSRAGSTGVTDALIGNHVADLFVISNYLRYVPKTPALEKKYAKMVIPQDFDQRLSLQASPLGRGGGEGGGESVGGERAPDFWNKKAKVCFTGDSSHFNFNT